MGAQGRAGVGPDQGPPGKADSFTAGMPVRSDSRTGGTAYRLQKGTGRGGKTGVHVTLLQGNMFFYQPPQTQTAILFNECLT